MSRFPTERNHPSILAMLNSWGYYGSIVLLDLTNKANFLLSKEYINIYEFKEILILQKYIDEDYDTDKIIELLIEKQGIYISLWEWSLTSGLIIPDIEDDTDIDSYQFIKVLSFELEGDNSPIDVAVSTCEINNIPRSYIARNGMIKFLRKKINYIEELPKILYTKSSFIKEYIGSLNNPKLLEREIDSYNNNTSSKEVESIQSYLSKNHKSYSSELAMCIELWNDLYINNYGNSNQGIKRRIKAWLTERNKQEPKYAYLNKISSIVNYDKNPHKQTKK